ncbi:MAG TPA: histidinol-phosphate transaminase [Devosiaceae bacterium]|jgi:histidinol-phosphate aminotransferase
MVLKVPVAPHVNSIPPYKPGRAMSSVAREFGLQLGTIVKMASNENPLGMSPKAREAVNAFSDDLARYPDPECIDLRSALARKHNVPMDWIIVGNGSAEILQTASRAFLSHGRAGLASQYSFTSYQREAEAAGARCIMVPARDYGVDLGAMADAITDDVQLIFIGNPNNPTGTWAPPAEMEKFLKRVPADKAVIVDEAYFEFLEPEEQFDSIQWVHQYPNLIVTRTFSKIFGMAAMRIGYGIAQPDMIEVLNRLRLVFNVGAESQAAALAALGDKAFEERSRTVNKEGMAQLVDGFNALGLRYIPSKGNFIMVQVGDAAAANRELLQRGVIVRPIANYGLPEWLRVTVGLKAENARFLDQLAEVLQKVRAAKA